MLWIKQKGMTQWELGEGIGQTGTLRKDYQQSLCESEMFKCWLGGIEEIN